MSENQSRRKVQNIGEGGGVGVEGGGSGVGVLTFGCLES